MKLHIVGVGLAVTNAVLAAVAASPTDYGITAPYVGPWLALVVLAIGMILKEMPSASQQIVDKQQKEDIKNLGGQQRGNF